jgi:hypothetical protein
MPLATQRPTIQTGSIPGTRGPICSSVAGSVGCRRLRPVLDRDKDSTRLSPRPGVWRPSENLP